MVLFSCEKKNSKAPTELRLILSDNALKTINNKREKALQVKHLYSSKKDYVPGVLVHDLDTIQVKARLKGDHLDHLVGDRWSFRIKTKTPVLGHRKFSVHNVASRRYQLEWAFHELLKEVGVIGLDYHFVQFSVNDSLKGIYAYESHFKNEVLDSNHRKHGPILGFDESSHWKGSIYDTLHFLEKDDSLMVHADLKIYNKKWCNRNPSLKFEALRKLKMLQAGKGRVDTIIDINKWAKYIAVSELMGFFHNLRWHNLKMYFNPNTKLLEPIGYDAGANFDLNYIWFLSDKVELVYKPMLRSKSFMTAFKDEINNISQEDFLDDFFDKNREELEYYEYLNQLEHPQYEFQERAFYYAQDKLQRELKKFKVN